jgi:hypothetical protein
MLRKRRLTENRGILADSVDPLILGRGQVDPAIDEKSSTEVDSSASQDAIDSPDAEETNDVQQLPEAGS